LLRIAPNPRGVHRGEIAAIAPISTSKDSLRRARLPIT